MAWEGHSWGILACVKFENMNSIPWCCCEILPTIWEFYKCAVSKWVYIFKITHWLAISLQVEYP
jgi:hypothetical protein